MTIEEITANIDAQMLAKRNAKPLGDRRQENVPVAEERRKGPDRRGAPRRENFTDNPAYNKAYDRWAENQR